MDVDSAGVGALIVGGLTAITSFVLTLKKQSADNNRSDFQIVNESLRTQLSEARAELKEERAGRASDGVQYEKEVEKLNWQIARLETMLDGTLPFARWSKDVMGRYRYVNPQFIRKFLQPIGKSEIDIYGKTDAEFWPNENGHYTDWIESMAALEERVMKRPEAEATKCGVKIRTASYTIVKWADRSSIYEVTGRFGMACLEGA